MSLPESNNSTSQIVEKLLAKYFSLYKIAFGFGLSISAGNVSRYQQ